MRVLRVLLAHRAHRDPRARLLRANTVQEDKKARKAKPVYVEVLAPKVPRGLPAHPALLASRGQLVQEARPAPLAHKARPGQLE